MQKNFEIRSYGRTELALRYNPHLTPQSAWRTLHHWIRVCSPLNSQLHQMGYTPSVRRFTPAQVALIIEYLGEP